MKIRDLLIVCLRSGSFNRSPAFLEKLGSNVTVRDPAIKVSGIPHIRDAKLIAEIAPTGSRDAMVLSAKAFSVPIPEDISSGNNK